MIGRVLCLFNKHRPRRSAVHWDGTAYVGTCKACGVSVRRLSKGNWKKDRPDSRRV